MLKLLITTLTLVILSLLGWGYFTVQKGLNPILEELKAKDQHEYEQMLAKFKGFSFNEGMTLYHHLKDTSKAKFIEIRFREMRSKWYEEKDFRKEERDKEAEARKLRKKGMELGADRFITKPCDPTYLIEEINTLLANKPQAS